MDALQTFGSRAAGSQLTPQCTTRLAEDRVVTTYHNVPSTSNTTPFNFGALSAVSSPPSFNGAKRLGVFGGFVDMTNSLFAMQLESLLETVEENSL